MLYSSSQGTTLLWFVVSKQLHSTIFELFLVSFFPTIILHYEKDPGKILKNLLKNGRSYSIIHDSFVSHFGAEQGRTSRGDSGALYLQSALAGMNPGPRTYVVSTDLDKQR